MVGLPNKVELVLSKVKDDDAYWTSDIAHDAGMKTAAVHTILKRLEWANLVERIVKGGMGHPTSWRRTPLGRSVLSEHNKPEA